MCVDLDRIKIEATWKEALKEEFLKPYFAEIKRKYLIAREEAKAINKAVFPPASLLFQAFNMTPFDRVRVVILGQDPYHKKGEAMGLCFSVPKQIPIPPSLKNIYKELHRSLGIEPANHGDLSAWTTQGVFMLNSILSVEENKAGSHKHLGWQEFTDAAIKTLCAKKPHVIFVLWGNYAKAKKSLIDPSKHTILESVHPSPLAGNRFIGNDHFALINRILTQRGETPINWSPM